MAFLGMRPHLARPLICFTVKGGLIDREQRSNYAEYTAIIAYVVTFFVNFIHAERWGFAFAVKHAKPGTFKFGLLLNLVVAGVFVVILDLIMTAIGMIAGGAFSFGPYIAAVLKGFIPCYVPTLIIAMFWNQVADKWSRAICNEPAPQMGPGPDQK